MTKTLQALEFKKTELLSDYQTLSLKDLLQKYQISSSALYRFLNYHQITKNRTLVDFGSKEQFTADYLELSKKELELKYGTKYANIKCKASNLGLKRPKQFVVYKESNLPYSYPEIVELYVKKKLSSSEIAKVCGISSSHWIRDILNKQNVKIREDSESHRKYKLNERFFQFIDCESKAYFLGLLAADGCNHEGSNGISIGLDSADKDILCKFSAALDSDLPIKLYEKNTGSGYSANLRIYSEIMKNDLETHGIIIRKSLVLPFPKAIPDALMHHYVRGYLDGDGCVFVSSKCHYQHYVGFTSSYEYLVELKEAIKRLTGLEASNLRKNYENGISCLVYKNVKSITTLYSFLYKDATLFLKRKYEKYQEILSSYKLFDLDNVFIDKSKWEQFTPHQLTMFKLKVFNYYRKTGFPYPKLPMDNRLKIFNSLLKVDTSDMIRDNVLIATVSDKMANSYFPHMYEVRCHSNPSPVDVFNDDILFKKVVESRIKHANKMNDHSILRGCGYEGQAVSNFKPKAAKALYEHFAGPDAVVWDMSMGWGGRLLGALASKNVKKYIGTDPNIQNQAGYESMINDFKHLTKVETEILYIGSEDYKPIPCSLDFCFTSPPYFNTERYSEERTQSYVKFPLIQDWVSGFLLATFKNCYSGLKPGKYMAINVKNVKDFENLEESTVKVGIDAGFVPVYVIQYQMALSMFQKNESKVYRYEPIYMFQKPQ